MLPIVLKCYCYAISIISILLFSYTKLHFLMECCIFLGCETPDFAFALLNFHNIEQTSY